MRIGYTLAPSGLDKNCLRSHTSGMDERLRDAELLLAWSASLNDGRLTFAQWLLINQTGRGRHARTSKEGACADAQGASRSGELGLGAVAGGSRNAQGAASSHGLG